MNYNDKKTYQRSGHSDPGSTKTNLANIKRISYDSLKNKTRLNNYSIKMKYFKTFKVLNPAPLIRYKYRPSPACIKQIDEYRGELDVLLKDYSDLSKLPKEWHIKRELNYKRKLSVYKKFLNQDMSRSWSDVAKTNIQPPTFSISWEDSRYIDKILKRKYLDDVRDFKELASSIIRRYNEQERLRKSSIKIKRPDTIAIHRAINKKIFEDREESRRVAMGIAQRFRKIIVVDDSLKEVRKQRKRIERYPKFEETPFDEYVVFEPYIHQKRCEKIEAPVCKRQVSIKVKKPKKRIADFWTPDLPDSHYEKLNKGIKKYPKSSRIFLMVQYLLERDTVLSKALAYGICVSMSKRYPKILDQFDLIKDTIEPQMETAGSVEQTTHIASNVAITSSGVVSKDEHPISEAEQGFQKFSIIKEPQIFETLFDRWLEYTTFTWAQDVSTTKLPAPIKIPHDLLKSALTVPNIKLFTNHRWFRGDVEFQFIANPSNLMVGTLVCAENYFAGTSNDLVSNVYTALQRNHVLIEAGKDNDAVLTIPYRNQKSMAAPSIGDNFAQLEFYELNSLQVPTNSTPVCYVTINFRFKNCNFSGLIDSSLGQKGLMSFKAMQESLLDLDNFAIEPQMDTISNLLNVGEGVLRSLGGDRNRDNPPISLQPQSLIPQSMTSLAYGDHIGQPVNMLRLDPRGQTPMPIDSDEMSTKFVTSKYSFLQSFEWKATDKAGDMLLKTDVVPLLPVGEYPSYEVERNKIKIKVYVPTTVGYVASMFSAWRGSLVYRFDVVCGPFHRGALVIGAIPLGADTPTAALLRSSLNMTFKIENIKSCEIVVPYNYGNPFCSILKDGLSGSSPCKPSSLYVFVRNNLVTAQGVAQVIKVNVFVKAGLDFELAIPRQSWLDVGISDPMQLPTVQYLHPYHDGLSVFTTWHKLLVDDDGYNYLTMYFSNVDKSWYGWIDANGPYYYKATGTTILGRKCRLPYFDALGNVLEANFFAWDPILSTANCHGLILCKSAKDASAFSSAVAAGKDVKKQRKLFCLRYFKPGGWIEWEDPIDSGKYVVADNISDAIQLAKVPTNVSYPQIDTQPIVLEKFADKTSDGLSIYGESFSDLKSYCRRYNHYFSTRVSSYATTSARDVPYSLKFRVCPFRRVKPLNSSSFDNRVRHGMISLVAGMYRYWRGSLRFRLVVTGLTTSGTTVFVSHRPDIYFDDNSISYSIGPKKVKTRNDLLTTQYASFAQSIGVNNVFEIEVPYYQTVEYSSLNFFDKPELTDNGSVFVWLTSDQDSIVNLEVYYSLADDCRFSVFQGVPGVINLDEIKPEPDLLDEPEPQMETEKDTSWSFANFFKPKVVHKAEAAIVKTEEEIKKTCTSLREVLNNLTSTEGSFKQRAKKSGETFVQWLKENCFSCIRIFSHLLHIYCNPKKSTVILAIFSICAEIFSATIEWEKFTSALSKYFTFCSPSTAKQQPQPQGGDDSSVSEIVTVLLGLITSFIGVKISDFKGKAGFVESVKKLGVICRASTFIGTFVEIFFKVVKKCISYIMSFFGDRNPNMEILTSVEDPRLRSWMSDATFVTCPSNKEKILSSHVWAQKVFELHVVGRAFNVYINTLDIKGVTQKIARLIQDLNKHLDDLQKELISRKLFSGARYEPFCLWLAGPAGSMKTSIANKFAEHYADSINYSGPYAYHTMTAGQSYFDAYVDQPTIILDDFMSIAPHVNPVLYGQFLQMKSSAIFNPPYAQVEDKSRTVNFQNLVVTSNFDRFIPTADIHDTDAYNRRRDCLLVMEFINKGNEIVNASNYKTHYSEEEYSNLQHVRVIHKKRVLDATESFEIQRVPGEKYLFTVIKYIYSQAQAYHVTAYKLYLERVASVQKRLSQIDSSASMEDHLKEFHKYLFDGNSEYCADYLTKWLDSASSSFTVPIVDISETNLVPESQMENFYDASPQMGPDETYDLYKLEMNKHNLELLHHEISIYDGRISDSRYYIPWPYIPEGKVIPSISHCSSGYHYQIPDFEECHHKLFKPDMVVYDYIYEIWKNNVVYPSSIPGVREGPCMVRKGSTLVPLEDCMWSVNRNKFYQKILANLPYSEYLASKDGALVPTSDETKVPPAFIKFLEFLNRPNDEAKKEENEIVTKTLSEYYDKIKKEYVVLGNTLMSRKSRWQYIKDTIWEDIVSILSVLYKIVKYILVVLACFVLYRGISYMFGSKVEGQLEPSGDYKTIKQPKSIQHKAMELVNPQNVLSKAVYSNPSTCSFDGVVNKIKNNAFYLVGIVVKENEVEHYKVPCVGLYDKTFLMIKHFLDYFKAMGVSKFGIGYFGGKGVFYCDFSEIEFIWTKQESGYGIGKLPSSAPMQFRNIVKNIPPSSFSQEYASDCFLMEIFHDSYVLTNLDVSKLKDAINVASVNHQQGWTINQGFVYNYGGKGKCGSLLLCPSMATPIIGVHTAGVGNKKGFSEMLFRETFMSSKPVIEYIHPQLEQEGEVYALDGSYYQEGILDKQCTPKMSSKTRIEPSLIHGVFEVKTEPAPLQPYDFRLEEPADIYNIGVSKRCDPLKEFPQESVEEAVEDLKEKLLISAKPRRTTIGSLTMVQAIEGFDIPGYEAIQMGTSEGFPWSLMRPKECSDKSWLFLLGDSDKVEVHGIQKDLLNILEIKHNLRSKGLVPCSYFSTCLKDSRILKEKIPIPGKTRIFEMSPIELTIAQRQFFLDFDVAYRMSRFEHTIGINPDGEEWSDLANSLSSFSPFILTADYSGYGPKLSSRLLEFSFDISIEWYNKFSDEDNSLIQECLKHEVAHGLHIAKNLVFRPTSGLPSGNCETVERNSLVNSLYIRIAYLELAKVWAPSFADVHHFNKFVLLFHNGDDLIASVKPQIISWFNNATLIEFFSKFGLKMTDAKKEGKIRPYCSLEEASYLKRGFMKHPYRPNCWLAPLEESSITDTANWIWRSVDNKSASLVNSEMSCRLAYTRGPNFYSRIKTQIKNAWKEKGVIFSAPSWFSIDSHVWDGEPGPLFSFS